MGVKPLFRRSKNGRTPTLMEHATNRGQTGRTKACRLHLTNLDEARLGPSAVGVKITWNAHF